MSPGALAYDPVPRRMTRSRCRHTPGVTLIRRSRSSGVLTLPLILSRVSVSLPLNRSWAGMSKHRPTSPEWALMMATAAPPSPPTGPGWSSRSPVFGSVPLPFFGSVPLLSSGLVPLFCSWVSFPCFVLGFRSLALLLGFVPLLCWVAFPSFVGLRSLAHRPRSVARPRRRTPDDSASLSSVAHISMFPVSFRLGLAPRALRLLLLVGHRFVRAPTVQFVTQGVGQDVRGP